MVWGARGLEIPSPSTGASTWMSMSTIRGEWVSLPVPLISVISIPMMVLLLLLVRMETSSGSVPRMDKLLGHRRTCSIGSSSGIRMGRRRCTTDRSGEELETGVSSSTAPVLMMKMMLLLLVMLLVAVSLSCLSFSHLLLMQSLMMLSVPFSVMLLLWLSFRYWWEYGGGSNFGPLLDAVPTCSGFILDWDRYMSLLVLQPFPRFLPLWGMR